jgi:gluconate 5-dehydrogenase
MNVFDQFRLDGKVAMITGGSRGLGLEIAGALSQAGARVALLGRREKFFDGAREILPDALCLTCDVADHEQITDAAGRVQKELGHIAVLVNSAGISWGAPATEMPPEKFRQVMAVNVDGSFYACQAVAPAMLEKGYGKIINIASVAGLQGEPPEILDAVGYASSKGAVMAMTRDLAVKWGPHGIRVNALAPGFFPSRMTATLPEGTFETIAKHTPLRRVGNPGELAGAGLYLASPASDYVSGHTLIVDGGATA